MIANSNRTLSQIIAAQLIEMARERAATRARTQVTECGHCLGHRYDDDGEQCSYCAGEGEVPVCCECHERPSASWEEECCRECADDWQAKHKAGLLAWDEARGEWYDPSKVAK